MNGDVLESHTSILGFDDPQEMMEWLSTQQEARLEEYINHGDKIDPHGF